jgi:tetratricopeptide (TPR) repeat protein
MSTIIMKPVPEQAGVPRQILLRRAAGYLELGGLLVDPELGAPPSAERLLKRALAELAALPTEVRGAGMASLIEGEALRALGRWEAALVPLQRASEADRSSVSAWLGLGWCLKRLGRLPEAIQALEAGLGGSPREPVLLYNLACYHSLAGHVASAIDYLRRAIAIDDRFRDLTGTERDFDPIRSDPRFQAATHVIA